MNKGEIRFLDSFMISLSFGNRITTPSTLVPIRTRPDQSLTTNVVTGVRPLVPKLKEGLSSYRSVLVLPPPHSWHRLCVTVPCFGPLVSFSFTSRLFSSSTVFPVWVPSPSLSPCSMSVHRRSWDFQSRVDTTPTTTVSEPGTHDIRYFVHNGKIQVK